ncbi:16S RNA G1207 methylase RsmC [Citricoccus zhacaiensis]|uniref:16S RNA G1207 methylase RsmC n=1 Tax=Citricoccus zhacaiensis TaxID=489142 RepID=A0ABQ2LN55_9MICC|nr:methyltransferase [Citricoccus zhacaiensis]GGO40492.1 16S RNA G1207 methylase RsmC [Citricoccus zhacaiensis]
MDSAHYFSAEPVGPEQRRRLSVTLAGRDVTVETAGGIFSPDGLDKGTAAMLRTVPDPPASGSFLDIGTGWGPLTLTLALSSPGAQVTGVEVNDRAAQLCRDNAAALGLDNISVYRPDEVPAEQTFDLTWSNPPIRVGKEALHSILLQWLPRLAPGGRALLVVQKNLGADSLLPWMAAALDERFPGQFTASRFGSEKGFRILQVDRIR